MVAALAGCTGDSTNGPDGEFDSSPSWILDNAVYHPAHRSGMKIIGTQTLGDRTIGLFYTYSERFWTVTGTEKQRVAVDSEYNTIHLMASVWDTETETVLPVDAGLSIRVEQDGDVISDRAMWPMLSQQMGAHFGDNVQFPSQDEYSLVVSTGSPTVERFGALDDLSDESGTVTFDFTFRRTLRNEIRVEPSGASPLPSHGEPDALSPMEMGFALSIAPPADQLPGRVLGEGRSGDAVFVVTATESADGTQLVVSPRTPYNQYILPLMSLTGTLEREGTTIFDGPLTTAISPEQNYHYYGMVDSIESGDELTISVDSPPQASRHIGYDTAFLEMPDMTMTVS